jgi:hypothetical protein
MVRSTGCLAPQYQLQLSPLKSVCAATARMDHHAAGPFCNDLRDGILRACA